MKENYTSKCAYSAPKIRPNLQQLLAIGISQCSQEETDSRRWSLTPRPEVSTLGTSGWTL